MNEFSFLNEFVLSFFSSILAPEVFASFVLRPIFFATTTQPAAFNNQFF